MRSKTNSKDLKLFDTFNSHNEDTSFFDKEHEKRINDFFKNNEYENEYKQKRRINNNC